MSSPRIFVSYARADGAAAARALSHRLTHDHGFSIWRDLADLEGGEEWWRQIMEAIDHVEYLVLVITPAACMSTAVRDEWRYARRRGVCVVPVIGGPAASVPELPGWMQRLHVVNVDEPEQWTRLVRTLEGPCRTPRVPMMADPPPPDFVARPEEIAAVRSLLVEHGGSVALTAALKGAGGYGKTTLARAVSYDALVQETYGDGVLWVTLGEQPGDPAAMLEDLIVTLAGESSGLTSADARRRRLDELLRDRGVLIVIDDVWNAAHLQPFMVGGDRCARLITTRDASTLPADAQEVRVDAMQPAEAAALLAQGVGDTGDSELAVLAAHLGEWPLLLKLVNGLLRDRVQRAGETLPRAITHVSRLLDRRGYKAFDARDPVQRHDAVATTLAASTTRLTSEQQARLRELAVFPEDVEVPIEVVALLWRRTGSFDDVDTEACLHTLFTLSLLLEVNLATRWIRIHDVIRRYLADESGLDEVRRHHRELVAAYGEPPAGGWSSRAGADADYFFRYLPLHLRAGGEEARLRALLLDPDWIEAKLRRTDVGDILRDFDTYAVDQATSLMADAVRLSADVISRDPEAVLPQLLGRIDDGIVVEFGPLREAWRARRRGKAWLCPRTPTLVRPGGALVQTFRLDSYPSRGPLTSSGGRDVMIDLLTLQDRVTSRAVSIPGQPPRRLVVRSGRSCVELADMTTNVAVWSADCSDYPVLATCVTPDGACVAASAGYWGGTDSGHPNNGADAVHVWQAATGREVLVVEGPGIRRFRISVDGRRLALAFDAAVELWSIETRARLARWACADVAEIRIGTEPDQVVVASWQGEVTIWTCGTDQPVTTIGAGDQNALAVGVSPDGRTMVRALPDGRLECVRIASNQMRSVLLRSPISAGYLPIVDVFVSDDATTAISRERGGTYRVWNLEVSDSYDHSLPDRSAHIIALTPDGRHAPVGMGDGSAGVRDESTHATTVLHHLRYRRNVDFPRISGDGRWVLNQHPDGTWDVWSTATGEQVGTLPYYRHLVVAGDSRLVYVDTRRDPDLLCVVDLNDVLMSDSRPSARVIELNAGSIVQLAVAPDGGRLVVLTERGQFVWDIREPAPHPLELAGVKSWGASTVRTDGRSIVLCEWDWARVFDWETGEKLLEVELGSEDAVMTPSGRRVLLSRGEVVTLWNLDTRARESSFHADAPVHAIACPSETSFIVCSGDGRVHTLDLRD